MPSPDALIYIVAGLAFLGMTMSALMDRPHLPSVPILTVAAGALLALTPMAALVLDPQGAKLALTAFKHASELIVIIAIAGAALAIDRPGTLAGWGPTWLLLVVAMPLTMGGLTWLGMQAMGLPLASALLLAAVLAPTDPVLARSVQVDGPNARDEHEVRVALTAEAGLNDGLAFPFVYLALAVAAASASSLDADAPWFVDWLWFDVGWRLAAGVALGWLVGHAIGRFVHGPHGDAQREAKNAGLVVMGTIFLSYGVAEAAEGYGFLAVFVAARALRNDTRREGRHGYIEHPHQFSDQMEKLMLALFMLWTGGYALAGGLDGLRWVEVGVAVALIVVLRPMAGYAALLPLRTMRPGDRLAASIFGIRGLGTYFYLAYAAAEGTFEGLEAVWRVCLVTVLISVFVHGLLAPIVMRRLE